MTLVEFKVNNIKYLPQKDDDRLYKFALLINECKGLKLLDISFVNISDLGVVIGLLKLNNLETLCLQNTKGILEQVSKSKKDKFWTNITYLHLIKNINGVNVEEYDEIDIYDLGEEL